MIKIQYLKKFCTSLFICFICLSCGVRSISRQGGNSLESSDYFTSFLAKDGVMLYFVKPIEFETKEKSLWLDFTFRKQNEKIKDTVNIGISVISKDKIDSKSIVDLFIDNQKVLGYEIVFNEPSKKANELRILTKTSYSLFKNYSDTSIVKIKYLDKEEVYLQTNRTKKIINILKKDI
jgi:hypothetical protein